MLKKLYFITGNALKAAEAQAILDFPIEIKKLEIEEIQDLSLEKVAKQKALDAFKILKKPLIVDDTGLYLDIWNGFPGPFVKYILKAGSYSLLVRMMGTESNRNVMSRGVIAFHDGGNVHTFVGETKGKISESPHGDAPFESWEPIFIPDGQTLTYAEMGFEEKNKISHRRKALEKLKVFLIENNYIKG